MSRMGRNINVSFERLRHLGQRQDRPRHIAADAGTCPRCDSHYSADEMRRNLRVCSACGHHFPVSARERLEQLGGARRLHRVVARAAGGRPLAVH